DAGWQLAADDKYAPVRGLRRLVGRRACCIRRPPSETSPGTQRRASGTLAAEGRDRGANGPRGGGVTARMAQELEGRLAPYGAGLAHVLRERLTPVPALGAALARRDPYRPGAHLATLVAAGGPSVET